LPYGFPSSSIRTSPWIGLDRVAGFPDGGNNAWKSAGQPVETLPQTTVADLHTRLEGDTPSPLVLDVRGPDEWSEGHIEGASHAYAGAIAQGAPIPFNPGQEIAVICDSGYRSSVVASLLQQRGYTSLINVNGGMGAWNEAKFPSVQ
jgi:hydroxyacylglutathione hydrolase